MTKFKPEEIFKNSFFSTKDKLKNFSKYVRRQDLARFMVFFELFKKQMNFKNVGLFFSNTDAGLLVEKTNVDTYLSESGPKQILK